MAERLRILPAGSDAFLVETTGLDATLSLFESLKAQPIDGINELVPAERTLLVGFDRYVASRGEIAARILALPVVPHDARAGATLEVPVVYDGEDLDTVAELLGWSVDELVRRHTAATYTVAFTGFAPGFAYMTCDDPAFDVPRRGTPRLRIPAGAVAIAGKFGGIYPSDSPGGWQLLGRTPLILWDTDREPPALLAPGMRVRFRDTAFASAPTIAVPPTAQPDPDPSPSGLRVMRADRPALFQDDGRIGRAAQGLVTSGALDRDSHHEANLRVGNARNTPTLEITLGGFALRADRPVTLAVAGAPCRLTIRTSDGRDVTVPSDKPFALDAGDAVTLGPPPEGVRSYLALRGGFAVAPVLGSAATDTLAKLGPPPVGSGDVLLPADRPAGAVAWERPEPRPLPRPRETVTLDVVLGPRLGLFTDESVALFLSQPWQVTAESSRIGMRLAGDAPLRRRQGAEIASEGTVLGAIQVTHDGQPVLFLADHPLTGGYPVIAVVARHHLDRAGQIPVGAAIRFQALSDADSLDTAPGGVSRRSSRLGQDHCS